MNLAARFPRLAAWLLVIALVGVVTLCAVQGLHALEPGAPAQMEHEHGIVIAMRGADDFAMRVPGHAGVVWFRVGKGAHISLDHLRRHMNERAPTDVYYLDQQHGPLIAWIAD